MKPAEEEESEEEEEEEAAAAEAEEEVVEGTASAVYVLIASTRFLSVTYQRIPAAANGGGGQRCSRWSG